jgi:hypothetical protein
MTMPAYQRPQMGSSASTAPGSRAFGSVGSLSPPSSGRAFGAPGAMTVDTPSLLQRRDAITGAADEARHERNLYKRTFREFKRQLRRGDAQAGLAAISLSKDAGEAGIELTGIPSANKEFNTASTELYDQMQMNAQMQGLVTPNETTTTPPPVADASVEGGPTGIPVTPPADGPAPDQGGQLGGYLQPGGGRPYSSFDREGNQMVPGGPSTLAEAGLSLDDQQALKNAATPTDQEQADADVAQVAAWEEERKAKQDEEFARQYPSIASALAEYKKRESETPEEKQKREGESIARYEDIESSGKLAEWAREAERKAQGRRNREVDAKARQKS